ncbi:MAG: hypothetical protein OXI61_02095 [Candidatus Poribacteria bacterium]|nr:hypothetical protein [Candidatus Poribacteria bacterium]
MSSYQLDGDPLTTYNLGFQRIKKGNNRSTGSTPCIYCNEFRECSDEHFLQRALVDEKLLGTNLDPVFSTAICGKCNNRLGQIDEILTNAPYLAEVSKALKQELNFESNSRINDNINDQLSVRGMRVIHYLVLDSGFPFLGRNKVKLNHFNFSHPPVPLAPQVVFIWDELAFKAVAKEWPDAKFQDKLEITNSKKEPGKYSIENVVEFCPPSLLKKYLEDKRELEQKFLKAEKICIVMPLEKPEESDIARFYDSLSDELKAKIERGTENTSNKPKKGDGRTLIIPHIKSKLYPTAMRGMVKNAFHSFLYAYSIHSDYNKDWENEHQYRGSESMFDGVRDFILRGVGNVGEFIQKIDPIENIRFLPDDSNFYHYHYHRINFHITEGNIGCIVSYFLGLKGVNECYQVLLARNPDFQGSEILPVNNQIFIPFRVHSRSSFYDSLAIEQPLLHYPTKTIQSYATNLIYNHNRNYSVTAQQTPQQQLW